MIQQSNPQLSMPMTPIVPVSSIEYYKKLRKDNTERLVVLLEPHIFSGLKIMYEKAKESQPNSSIIMFQKTLGLITVLPKKTLQDDYIHLLKNVDENTLYELIKSIYGTSTNVPSMSKNRLNMNFIHDCYIQSARNVYSVADKFSTKVPLNEQLTNSEIIKLKIGGAIKSVIYDIEMEHPLTENFTESVNANQHPITSAFTPATGMNDAIVKSDVPASPNGPNGPNGPNDIDTSFVKKYETDGIATTDIETFITGKHSHQSSTTSKSSSASRSAHKHKHKRIFVVSGNYSDRSRSSSGSSKSSSSRSSRSSRSSSSSSRSSSKHTTTHSGSKSCLSNKSNHNLEVKLEKRSKSSKSKSVSSKSKTLDSSSNSSSSSTSSSGGNISASYALGMYKEKSVEKKKDKKQKDIASQISSLTKMLKIK